MKKLFYAAVLTAFLFLNLNVKAQTTVSNAKTEYARIEMLNDSTIRIPLHAKVPAGEVYNIFDNAGKFIATYTSDRVITHIKKATDCVQIKCPKSFKKVPGGGGIRCWRCW